MDSKYYEYLIATAEYGNISKAAQSLFITQPALSKATIKIEEEYGIKIFERSNGKLVPTVSGDLIINAGKDILKIEKNYKYELDEINNLHKGSLTISITPTRDLYILPIVLPEFRKKFPDFDLEINEQGINEIENSILNKESKIGIYITDNFNTDLNYEIIQEEEVVIGIAANSKYINYVEDKKEFKFPWIDLTLLKDEIFFISNPYKAKLGSLANIYFEEYNIKPKTMVIKNMETRLSLASIGEGIAFSYEIGNNFIDIDDKKLVFLSIGKKRRSDKFVISYLKEAALNDAYKEFINITKNYLKK